MKKQLFLFCSILLFFSCSEDSETGTDFAEQQLKSTLIAGEWAVDLFIEDGENETSNYEPMRFRFLSGGQVEVSISGDLIDTGNWMIRSDDGWIILDLSFSDQDPLVELSDDWHLIGFNDNRVELEEDPDDSNEDGALIFVQR